MPYISTRYLYNWIKLCPRVVPLPHSRDFSRRACRCPTPTGAGAWSGAHLFALLRREVESVHVIVLSLRVRTLPASLYASTGFNVQSTKVGALYKFMRTHQHRQSDTLADTPESLLSPLCLHCFGSLGIWRYFIRIFIFLRYLNALSRLSLSVLKRDSYI